VLNILSICTLSLLESRNLKALAAMGEEEVEEVVVQEEETPADRASIASEE
jgi:hypothetical protein|tara:strand:- start:237 stop:389 length:153 start_codon:yes stop_codon:yes gene_type:complete